MKIIISTILALLCTFSFAQEGIQIASLEQALDLADKNSSTTKLAREQQNLAGLTRQSAYGNTLNPRIPVTASLTNNTQLPVNFLPGEIFGGPTRSFRQVAFGQQYVSVLNIAPQFDILNLGNITKIKSAKANEAWVASTNQINKKDLHDQVNACYHNILSFKAQIEVLEKSKQNVDSVYHTVKSKFNQGLTRQQEVNDAQISVLNTAENITQTKLALDHQYLTLQQLCDTESAIQVLGSLNDHTFSHVDQSASGELLLKNSILQMEYTRAEYLSAQWANMPVISFFSSFNYQNNSNASLLDQSNPWIKSNYYGLKLTWDLPTNVGKLAQSQTAKINYKIAEINAKHAELQNKIQNQQLEKDYLKAKAQYETYKKINALKEENYQKSKRQFEADVLSFDKLLLAQNDWLNSSLNAVSALANLSFSQSKININNQFR